MEKTPPMDTRLRALVEGSGFTLKGLAQATEVPYHALRRWFNEEVESIKLSHAETLWEFFTGMKFQ